MSDSIKRRMFIKSAALLGAGSVIGPAFAKADAELTGAGLHSRRTRRDMEQDLDPLHAAAPPGPISIASGNGLEATAMAVEMMNKDADTLDAVIAGVNIVENDPDDMSVGYGGLPNEDGVVELDSCVMHGPTGRGGGVAALQNIKNPSLVAQKVMQRTDHVLLVGYGALRFAKAHGFREEDLLTNKARERWLEWKENMSVRDDRLPPHEIDTEDIGGLGNPGRSPVRARTDHEVDLYGRPTGTINCLGINGKGDISGVTTTSGLAYKIPGRVGDSPILGAGLYVDNDVGAAGSTGRGEANLHSLTSVMIVEYMSLGESPEDACLMACERIARQTRMQRLLDNKGRPNFNVNFYALNRRGEFGAASIWSGRTYAVNTGDGESRLLDCASLYNGQPE